MPADSSRGGRGGKKEVFLARVAGERDSLEMGNIPVVKPI